MHTLAETHHILHVEDSEDDALLIYAQLRAIDRRLVFRRVQTADEMHAALAEREWDLVISDHQLPTFDAIRAFAVLRRHRPDTPFIIMSGAMPEQTAAIAMRLGADDFIDKANPARLVPVVERELRHARLRRAKEEVEKSLVRVTYHDALTGLPNAAMLTRLIEQSLARAVPPRERAVLVQVDIERFRRVNDSLGHAAGDTLLTMVAARLSQAFAHDAVVARLGQDKFALFFDRTATDALAIGGAVGGAFGKPFDVEGVEVFASAATGVCVYPDDAHDVATLLQRAERAMFAAKGAAPAQVRRYTHDLDDGVGEELRLENALRHAVSRSELYLLFQPIVDMASRRIGGVEALVRWSHPQYGVVGPEKFIRLADATGVIFDIGRWVLGAACRQLREWDRNGAAGLTLAVNVSAAQFGKPGFDLEVGAALAESGLSPERLELEITETVVMQDAEVTIATLRRLKSMGVRISIDDFGTGYSSLSYLKRFPIDVLKIDRSFLSRVTEDSDNQAIVRTVVALARTLKLEALAEGVETAEQFEFLRELGCDRAQGYLLGRPVAAGDIAALLGHDK
jgi:diguanylate cyclase (GGDEF)-like protein